MFPTMHPIWVYNLVSPEWPVSNTPDTTSWISTLHTGHFIPGALKLPEQQSHRQRCLQGRRRLRLGAAKHTTHMLPSAPASSLLLSLSFCVPND
jgi:hypothetical protein